MGFGFRVQVSAFGFPVKVPGFGCLVSSSEFWVQRPVLLSPAGVHNTDERVFPTENSVYTTNEDV